MQKYGLNNLNLLPCVNDKNTKIDNNLSFKYKSLRNDVPFPIINATMYINNNVLALPIEFTPLYYGISSSIEFDNLKIGSFYIEPIGFTSINSLREANIMTNYINTFDHNVNDYIEIDVQEPTHIISISKQMGISSNAIAEICELKINDNQNKKLDFPILNYYDPSGYFNNQTRLCDGGLIDNTGIIALIKRQVKNIIFCGSCPYVSNIISCNIDESNIASNFAGLFGVAESSRDIYINTNKYNKIFDSDKWDELIMIAKEKYEKNLPMMIYMKLNVLSNEYIGIKGGYEISIIFCQNYKNDWMEKISPELKKYINNDTIYFFDKILSYLSLYPMKFNNFPNIPVEILNYDIELVNAMIHIASYNIVNDKEKIKEFFNL